MSRKGLMTIALSMLVGTGLGTTLTGLSATRAHADVALEQVSDQMEAPRWGDAAGEQGEVEAPRWGDTGSEQGEVEAPRGQDQTTDGQDVQAPRWGDQGSEQGEVEAPRA
jgi:hypothetical protein